MDNFGVIEVPLHNARSTLAPGWAYVPDTGAQASISRGPAQKRRARTGPAQSAGASDLTAKQDAKIFRELAALDKEGGRDAAIPVPTRPKDGAKGELP